MTRRQFTTYIKQQFKQRFPKLTDIQVAYSADGERISVIVETCDGNPAFWQCGPDYDDFHFVRYTGKQTFIEFPQPDLDHKVTR